MAQEEDDPQDSRDMVLHTPGWGNEAWPPAWLPAPIRPMRGSVGRFSAAAVSSREECNNAQDFFGDLPVSDRVGHDKTGVGYKDPSLATNRSLALPSSSSTLPVDLQSTNTISLLVANVGFIDRSRRFSDFIAGNFSVVLLQEAHSCGISHRIAKARDMCILEGLGRVGSCMAVLAGQTGTKYLSRIYPTWDGLMERPYKDSAKQGDRIHSLVCLSAEVQWVNEANGGVISRAGLSSFRVTTVHVHNDEKRSVESCKLALKTLFWLALRDKHRVVAGDFNLEPQAIRDAVDCVIEQFEGASYEVLHGDRSAEICCVLLNFAKLPQLRGAVKGAVAERWTSEELRLSDNDADSHYPLILELSPLELREGDLRKRSAEAAAKRAQKKSKRRGTHTVKDPDEAMWLCDFWQILTCQGFDPQRQLSIAPYLSIIAANVAQQELTLPCLAHVLGEPETFLPLGSIRPAGHISNLLSAAWLAPGLEHLVCLQDFTLHLSGCCTLRRFGCAASLPRTLRRFELGLDSCERLQDATELLRGIGDLMQLTSLRLSMSGCKGLLLDSDLVLLGKSLRQLQELQCHGDPWHLSLNFSGTKRLFYLIELGRSIRYLRQLHELLSRNDTRERGGDLGGVDVPGSFSLKLDKSGVRINREKVVGYDSAGAFVKALGIRALSDPEDAEGPPVETERGMAQEEDDPQDSRDMVLHTPGWGNEAWPPAWLPAPARADTAHARQCWEIFGCSCQLQGWVQQCQTVWATIRRVSVTRIRLLQQTGHLRCRHLRALCP
ncbi:unnamed protein product [Cladocopium goreaui]|uniref:Endonuclease/exonuclease/phosphatase domain-containing protein n=1 Tax=Cladocopium goreaui TaxID=2562237 RepID=A0A9P1D4H1_9DINO|nr:unnamed protein product [Cladocopium goreaui]